MDTESWLAADVSSIGGVSARAARQMRSALGIATVRDLLEHYPHQDRYRDIGAVMPVHDAQLGEPLTVVGTVASWRVLRPRGRKLVIAKATLVDDSGNRVEAPFFNQEWRARRHPAGSRVAVSGVLERFRSKLQLRNPQLTELDEAQAAGDGERIQPTYPASEGLPSARIASYVRSALDDLEPLPDHLPPALRERHGLLDVDTALRWIHAPPDFAAIERARQRLVYDELLCLQVGLQRRRHRLESDAMGLNNAPAPDGLARRFLAALPFAPTGAQERAFSDLTIDLGRAKPMHRLLQGDVGTGKTIVAAWAMLSALDHGRQAVLMAPTEVLAEQHFRTFSELLAPLGVNVLDGPRLELVTGSTTQRKLRDVLAELFGGQVQLVIGTHALLEERVTFADLGVVIVDEQHRFGVEHRARLRDKRSDERTPDVLVMTATPIPRSLALTLYGDLDVTVLDELPPGRTPITTEVMAADSPRRRKLYEFIRETAAAGERTYVVCPLVSESQALEDVASAEQVHERLSEKVFPDLRVELVHGQLPAAERDLRMEAFRSGAAPILVATTVIEVGVDVAEATVMVIEDADRFGISQLHQLRGRIGRGSASRGNFCVLFSRNAADNPRLEALAKTTDGFRLADVDLQLRGEGSLFDTRQSGLPDLKLASLLRDFDWVRRTRTDARALIDDDPELTAAPALRAEVVRRYGDERLAALETG